METLEEKITRAAQEEITIADYNPDWQTQFEKEKQHLANCLPATLIRRIEHFGSTAVPGLCAKPIIDILVEVESLEETKKIIAPILELQGYDYFWRPLLDDYKPPFYAWFIKRNAAGIRTHHIHMVEKDSELWERLYFRDFLRLNPDTAKEYAELKLRLLRLHQNNRIAYTKEKTDFITAITQRAKIYFQHVG